MSLNVAKVSRAKVGKFFNDSAHWRHIILHRGFWSIALGQMGVHLQEIK